MHTDTFYLSLDVEGRRGAGSGNTATRREMVLLIYPDVPHKCHAESETEPVSE